MPELAAYLGAALPAPLAELEAWRCDSCGSFVQHPILPQRVYRDWYSNVAYDFQRGSSYGGWREMLEHAHAAFKRARAFVGGEARTILDVGCNRGVFLAVCKANGWTARGCEVSRRFATEARERFDLTVENVAFEDLATAVRFDLITFWDVFEHFAAPAAALAKTRDLLVPNGWVGFEVPNVRSIFARVLRRSWWFGFEHIYYYSPVGFCKLLRRSGFEPVRIETDNVNLLSREGLVRLGCFGPDAVWGRTPWPAGGEPSEADLAKGPASGSRSGLRAAINGRLNRFFNGHLLGDQLVVFARRLE